jgi:hypothetical protein
LVYDLWLAKSLVRATKSKTDRKRFYEENETGSRAFSRYAKPAADSGDRPAYISIY